MKLGGRVPFAALGRVSASLLVVVLLAGCRADTDEDIVPLDPPGQDEVPVGDDARDDDDAAGEPGDVEVPDEPPPPDEITEAYVEAVLNELERLHGDAIRAALEAGDVTDDVTERLRAIYTESQLDLRVRTFRQVATERAHVFKPPGEVTQRRRQVVQLLEVTQDCIWAETVLDWSGLVIDPVIEHEEFVLLRAEPGDRDSAGSATSWLVASLPAADADVLRGERPCAG